LLVVPAWAADSGQDSALLSGAAHDHCFPQEGCPAKDTHSQHDEGVEQSAPTSSQVDALFTPSSYALALPPELAPLPA
jgi:hypothetical protein